MRWKEVLTPGTQFWSNFNSYFSPECNWASFGYDWTSSEYKLGWICYTYLASLKENFSSKEHWQAGKCVSNCTVNIWVKTPVYILDTCLYLFILFFHLRRGYWRWKRALSIHSPHHQYLLILRTEPVTLGSECGSVLFLTVNKHWLWLHFVSEAIFI